MKLWNNNYTLNKYIEKFTVGNDYLLDQKLVKYDCLASIAHVKMLHKIGLISNTECTKMINELDYIIKLDGKGKFIIKQEEEDCHTAIENYLVKQLGEIGKKIHTGRSRNDQVLAALRLYYKNEIQIIDQLVDNLIEMLLSFKEKNGSIEIPGYTHMRKAMPSSIELWADAFVESMKDNKILIKHVFELIDQSPLGTGAGYGLPIKVDREMTADLLGFKKIQKNPIYVQNSRGKFESSILHMLSQILFDINKIASDIILFSMSEFGFFEIPEEFTTGSSIMPHKKNPDVLEILRSKYHLLTSYESQIKSMSSNLISGYHRDLQLIKEPIIKGLELTKECLNVSKLFFQNLHVNKENCNKALSKEVYATKEVYALVQEGLPFRDAYQKISERYH